jgi:hypothetical protein
MADRYWVGGTDSWDSTAGTKWATTSGGAGGAAVPTSSDDVYFDVNSGSVTITMSGSTKKCAKFNTVGFIGTIDAQSSLIYLTIYGDITLGTGTTFTSAAKNYLCIGIYGTISVTSNDSTLGVRVLFVHDDNSCTLLDDLTISNGGAGDSLYVHTGASFDANDYNVTLDGGFYTETSVSLYMGSGTWTVSSWYVNSAISCETSKIIIATSGTFYGYNNTYYDVELQGDSTTYIQYVTAFHDLTIKCPVAQFFYVGGCTINTLTIVRGVAESYYIYFKYGQTYTIGRIISPTNGATHLYFRSTVNGNVYYITKSGGGTNCLTYVDCRDFYANDANTWYMGKTSEGSVNSGNNTNVTFTKTPLTNPTYVYSDDSNYATVQNDDGIIYIALCGDAGTTYTSALSKTFTGSETAETYGAGASELWGTSWTGSMVSDTNFRLKIYGIDFEQIYKTFGFAPASDTILTGVEVVCKAYWDGTTTYINNIKIKIRYGTSSLPIQAGTQSYASDGRKNGEGAGAGTGVLVFYDGSNWCACDTGATVAA